MNTDFQSGEHTSCKPLLWLAVFVFVTNLMAGYLFPDYPAGFIFISLIFVFAITLNLNLLRRHNTAGDPVDFSDRGLSRLKVELATYCILLAALLFSYFLTLPE